MIAFPFYGVGKAAREIINLVASLEKLANETAEGFTKVNAEMVAMQTVAMQNCITFDVLLAASGGTCAVVGSECCTYIHDNSEEIDDLGGKIKAEGAKYDYKKGWNFGSWLEKMFGGWGTWILHTLLVGCMIFVTAVVIIACIRAINRCVCEKICHSDNDGGA